MVSAVGYSPESEMLEVEFTPYTKKSGDVVPGAIWQFSGVPQDVYDRFMAAESIGKFFGTYIRACYPGQRIEEKRDQDPSVPA